MSREVRDDDPSYPHLHYYNSQFPNQRRNFRGGHFPHRFERMDYCPPPPDMWPGPVRPFYPPREFGYYPALHPPFGSGDFYDRVGGPARFPRDDYRRSVHEREFWTTEGRRDSSEERDRGDRKRKHRNSRHKKDKHRSSKHHNYKESKSPDSREDGEVPSDDSELPVPSMTLGAEISRGRNHNPVPAKAESDISEEGELPDGSPELVAKNAAVSKTVLKGPGAYTDDSLMSDCLKAAGASRSKTCDVLDRKRYRRSSSSESGKKPRKHAERSRRSSNSSADSDSPSSRTSSSK